MLILKIEQNDYFSSTLLKNGNFVYTLNDQFAMLLFKYYLKNIYLHYSLLCSYSSVI